MSKNLKNFNNNAIKKVLSQFSNKVNNFCTLNFKKYDYGFKEVKFGPRKTRVIVNYNSNCFKLEEEKKLCNKHFLESFSKSIAPMINLKKDSYREVVQVRNKENRISDLKINKIAYKHSKTLTKYNGNDLRSMVEGKYLDEDDDILNYEKVLVTETNFNKESLLQRGIVIDFKKAYDRQFQECLNTLANTNSQRKFKPVSNEFKYYDDNIFVGEIKKMLIKSFFNKNSELLKFQVFENVDMSSLNRNNLKNIVVLNNSSKSLTNIIDTDQCLPISIANGNSLEEFEQTIFDNFNILAGLTRLNKHPYAIGIATNFTNWKILMYRNSFSKVETAKDFIVSDYYRFNAILNSCEIKGLEGSTNILLFNYFMEIIEKLCVNSSEIKGIYQNKLEKQNLIN